MPTGFDILSYDKKLQKYWVYRTLAGIVDISLIFFPTYIISLLFSMSLIPTVLIFHAIYYIYCSVAEGVEGRTLGKRLFNLRVVSHVGNISMRDSFGRNITKILLLFLLIDILIGLGTEGDPRQRSMDRIFDSLVIEERVEKAKHEHHILHHKPKIAISDELEEPK